MICNMICNDLYNICTIWHITKYLGPPAHQIWVTDPLQVGTAAGTSFTEVLPINPKKTSAAIRRAQKPLKAVLIHRIDIRQLHLGWGHWYHDISRLNTNSPSIRCAPHCIFMRRRCDSKEENCGPVGHRTVWPHQYGSIFLQHCVVPILLTAGIQKWCSKKICSGQLKSSVLEDLHLKCLQMFRYLRLIWKSGIVEHEFMTFSTYPGQLHFTCHEGSWRVMNQR